MIQFVERDVDETGWNILDAKSGRRWDLAVAPSVDLPPELGEGGMRLLGMHGGFQFCALDGRVHRTSQMFLTDPSAPEDRVSIMVMASLEGTLNVHPGGFLKPLSLEQGKVAIYHAPEPVMTVEMAPQRQRGFDAGFSRRLLQRVGEDSPLPGPLRRLAEGTGSQPFALPGRIDQRFGLLIEDLMRNPYTNGAARLYREAKGLEMIAMLIDGLDQRNAINYTRWKRRDVDAVEDARARLVSDLEEAPSLVELAQAVGMSATKLKRGFRDLFGTTITETLSEARLQRARHLLETSGLPLKTIALHCGFCDAASLSHAFVRRFGVTPGRARRA